MSPVKEKEKEKIPELICLWVIQPVDKVQSFGPA
jgi:hypothetical protein